MITETRYTLSPTTTIAVHSAIPSSTPTGLTLVFLHHWGGYSRTYTKMISSLVAEHAIYALDSRGWGSSTGPASETEYSVPQLADDTASVIAQLPIRDYVLVGHSMGGKTAQLIASRRPQGLKGLFLISTAPAGPLFLSEEIREAQLGAYDNRKVGEAVIRGMLSTRLSDEDVETFWEGSQTGSKWARAAWPKYAIEEDHSKSLQDIQIPVKVVVGACDKVHTVDLLRKEILEKVEGATMVIIEQAEHMLPLEEPEKMAEEIKTFCSGL